MARMCAFCTHRPDSSEPALAAWIARVLDGTDAPVTDAPAAGGDALPLSDRPAKIVCRSCQEHFDTTLEEPVSTLLRPAMLEATPVTLDAGERALVARWGVKTAACLLATRRGSPGVPAGQRLQIRAGEVPADAVVALGRAAVPGTALEVGRLRAPGGRASGDADASPWYMAMTAGHVVVLAWGLGAVPAGAELAPPPALQFTRLTGDQPQASWPPMWSLEAHDLDPLPPMRLQRAGA
jgi:hypothetical protein